jgi:hypothetical protein
VGISISEVDPGNEALLRAFWETEHEMQRRDG